MPLLTGLQNSPLLPSARMLHHRLPLVSFGRRFASTRRLGSALTLFPPPRKQPASLLDPGIYVPLDPRWCDVRSCDGSAARLLREFGLAHSEEAELFADSLLLTPCPVPTSSLLLLRSHPTVRRDRCPPLLRHLLRPRSSNPPELGKVATTSRGLDQEDRWAQGELDQLLDCAEVNPCFDVCEEGVAQGERKKAES